MSIAGNCDVDVLIVGLSKIPSSIIVPVNDGERRETTTAQPVT